MKPQVAYEFKLIEIKIVLWIRIDLTPRSGSSGKENDQNWQLNLVSSLLKRHFLGLQVNKFFFTMKALKWPSNWPIIFTSQRFLVTQQLLQIKSYCNIFFQHGQTSPTDKCVTKVPGTVPDEQFMQKSNIIPQNPSTPLSTHRKQLCSCNILIFMILSKNSEQTLQNSSTGKNEKKDCKTLILDE